MADITTELQTLKDAVTAETDQDVALAAVIDGAVSAMASGVAEIKTLAQQLLTVANDPQMVRDLAAQLKTATDTQASKLAALQAASGDLATAVMANTPAVAGASGGASAGSGTGGSASGSSGPVSAPTSAPGPASEPVSGSSEPTIEPATGPATPSAVSGDTGGQLDPAGGHGSL